jgi:hypothetical protein
MPPPCVRTFVLIAPPTLPPHPLYVCIRFLLNPRPSVLCVRTKWTIPRLIGRPRVEEADGRWNEWKGGENGRRSIDVDELP